MFYLSGRIYFAELNFHRTPFIEDNSKWMSGIPGKRNPKFRTGMGIYSNRSGTGNGKGKGIEVRFKGRKKKDAVNDHILLRNKT